MTITDKQLDDWWSDQSFDTKLVVRKLIAEVRRLREDNDDLQKCNTIQHETILQEVREMEDQCHLYRRIISLRALLEKCVSYLPKGPMAPPKKLLADIAEALGDDKE
jgi:hypothetical protein